MELREDRLTFGSRFENRTGSTPYPTPEIGQRAGQDDAGAFFLGWLAPGERDAGGGAFAGPKKNPARGRIRPGGNNS